jgi:hypothetical protein
MNFIRVIMILQFHYCVIIAVVTVFQHDSISEVEQTSVILRYAIHYLIQSIVEYWL